MEERNNLEFAIDVQKTLGDYLFKLSERLKREVRRHLIEFEDDPEVR